jgi:uncharacterized membrane protein (UPF0182 family)
VVARRIGPTDAGSAAPLTIEELPVAMRPPIPSLILSRRAKIALLVVAVLIVLFIIANVFVGVYINWLWYGSVGFRSVYTTIFWTRVALFFIFGLIMAAGIGASVVVAYAARPPFRPLSPEQQNLERYRVILEPRKKLLFAALLVIVGFASGMAAQGDWQIWQLWLNGGSFGVKDAQFHRDISFFAWDYPAYRTMLSFGFALVIFSIILSVAVYYVFGAIRIQTPGPKITLSARRHLTILIFVFIVFKAIAYWLDRYGLVYSARGQTTGASYADINAALPAKTILFWIAIIIAILVIASLWLKSARLPGIAFVVLLLLSIVINGIYPAIVQQFTVKPNASQKEAPYISRNIAATRAAYGINSTADGGTVDYANYNVTATPSTSDLDATSPTISDIRILDPNVLSPTFTQQQQLKNVYGFAGKLDVDRYDINGTTRDYVVGVRELKAANLNSSGSNGNQNNWINGHTVYTHGYGFVAAQASTDVTSTGDYTEGNIPPTCSGPGATTGSDTCVAPLTLKNPDAYFGELLPNYSIVGAGGTPREYDGTGATKVSYSGGGGVSLGNLFTRFAFALNYKETNFLLNDSVGAKGAKIILNRDPRQILSKVAPFLKVDSDPYPFVDTATGDITWMIDGYTTMSNYPYSEQESLSTLTSDSLSVTNKTASQPNDQINYIRNSVKATVDAYTGKVTLYQWDATDPVLKTWMKVFPGLVKPLSAMPAGVKAHVRYPEDLFEVQRALIASYHVDNPVTFYSGSDKWTVPSDPNDVSANQPPYYVLAAPPTGSSNSAEFQLTSPMKVNSRPNLAAFISVNSDPGANYGKISVLKLPNNSVIDGPEQIFNSFNTTPAISKDITLLSSGGSTVIHGNLLTLPIGNSFLYVEPLYVQGAASTGYPVLRAVLVAYGSKIGYASNVTDALANLTDPGLVQQLNPSGNTTTPSTTPSTPSTPTSSGSSPPSSSSSSPTTSSGAVTATQVLQKLNAAQAALQAAYKSGNYTAIGTQQALVNQLLQQYLALPEVAASAAASNTPSTSATPTTTPTK